MSMSSSRIAAEHGITLEIRGGVLEQYADIFTPGVVETLRALAPLDGDRTAVMASRSQRRRGRADNRQRITFLDPNSTIPRTTITVADARAGNFVGGDIPADLARQWIQGTGPATRPQANLEQSLRNAAYALLSGADGWMFDGEDALGQVATMSLDNQRNLKLAIERSPIFMKVAEDVSGEMNQWAEGFFGRQTIDDWQTSARFHDEDLPRARTASRRSPCAGGGWHRILRVDRRRGHVRHEQSRTPAPRRLVDRAVPAEDSDGRGSGALERHPVGARGAPRPPDRHDQGVRPRRAGRGVLPVDGDSGGPRPPLRRLQHRPLGLHQQRV